MVKFKKLYIIKFDNGMVKIGVGWDASDRIKAHKRMASRRYGAGISSIWESIRHINYSENEKTLIALIGDKALEYSKEWAIGVCYDELVAEASDFEFRVEMTDSEKKNEAAILDMLGYSNNKVEIPKLVEGCDIIKFSSFSSLNTAYKVCLGRSIDGYIAYHEFKEGIDPNSTLTPLESKCINDLVLNDERMISRGIPYSERIDELSKLYVQRHAPGLAAEVQLLES